MNLRFWKPARRLSRPKIQSLAAPRRRRWVSWVKWGGIVVGGLLIVGLVMAAYYYPKLKPAMASAQRAQGIAKKIPVDLSEQKFARGQEHIRQLETELAATDAALAKTRSLRAWPYLGRQYRAVEDLLAVGRKGTTAAGALVDFAAHLFVPFADRGKVSLATISPQEKGQLLAGITEREDSLKTAQVAIREAGQALNRIPEAGLIGPLQRVITPLKQQFPIISKAIDQAIPATHLLPPVLGYPDAKSYLFLLQNNNELRPGGGFIGTYGLLKVANGEIVSLKTDNSYNLDEAAKNLPVVVPPAPMQKYLKAKAWYFRDANWSPDFPTSAKQAIQFYEREGGQKNVDGVVAITPTTIVELLRLVGPITVYKIEFTPDNFTARLQDYVGQGFKQYGLSESQRKDIIGVMTAELVNRLLSLPLSDWSNLFLVLSQQLSQKQFLLYMQDPAAQGILVEQNWGGSIQGEATDDYIMVVDANLASLKTDSVMRRTYTYQVEIKNGRGLATLKIHYANTGKFDWRTSTLISRYNTFIRVYVPAGSQLIDQESSGAQIRERSNAPGKIETSTELGRTVFSAFKSIEPQAQSDLILKYSLPTGVVEQLKQKKYTLVWQKEPGMISPDIDLTVTTPDYHPESTTALDNQARLRQDAVLFTGPLSSDRFITLTYR